MSQTSLSKKSFKELFKISSVVYKETFLEGYLETQGPQRDSFIKKIKKNKNTTRNNAVGMKILSSIYMLFLNLIMIETIIHFQFQIPFINAGNFNSSLFAISSTLSLMFGMQLIFMYTFGMTSMVGFFDGKAFKMLFLHLNNKDVKKIALLTFLRTIDFQIVTVLLGLPIITLILTGSILTALVAVFVNVLHLTFGISLIIIISNFMSKRVFSNTGTSRTKTVIRVVIMVLYLIAVMSFSLILNLLNGYVLNLFAQSNQAYGPMLTIILSFIIYPFSLTYFFAISLFPADKIFLNYSWPVFVGIFFAIFAIFLLFKKAFKILKNVSKEQEFGTERKSGAEPKPIIISKVKPITAIFSKDIKYIIRNFSVFLYLLMPLIMPTFMTIIPIALGDVELESFSFMNIISLVYVGMSLSFLIIAVTGSENESGDLIQTLPVKQSDIYKGKRRIILSVMIFSQIIPHIIFLVRMPENASLILLNFVAFALIMFYLSEVTLVLYAVFFGKIRGKYTIQMLNPQNKILKIIIAIILIYLLAFIPPIITAVFGIIGALDLNTIYIVQLVLVLSILIPIKIIAYRTLEHDGKKSKILENKVMSTFIILFIYFMFLLIGPYFLVGLGIYHPIVEIIITLVLLSVLFLFVVPYGFGFPQQNKSFKDYLVNIKLSKVKPIGRNIIMGIMTSFTLLVGVMLVLIVSNYYVFNLNTILPPFSWSLLYMFIPGIFEEVAFRGIILSMMLKKYSKIKAVIFNSILFGVFHFCNLIGFALVGALSQEVLIAISFQVLYASVLSLSFGYMYVKTESLFPSILCHYLLDALMPLFSFAPGAEIVGTIQLYIVFLGLILPGLINLVIIKLSPRKH